MLAKLSKVRSSTFKLRGHQFPIRISNTLVRSSTFKSYGDQGIDSYSTILVLLSQNSEDGNVERFDFIIVDEENKSFEGISFNSFFGEGTGIFRYKFRSLKGFEEDLKFSLMQVG
ncbi:uncharacterized protein LOC107020340 [Solanum pennellii]|uniref:Uncharacterized protein LOC107020340 n=1 Tax=Solanum pennellii TaxID=28526 RepID=A0ABM1VBA3_SOLPN|nr:uncharacterized protein LOC107020340 [Solanum pennellii]XP_027773022.1 uncharacterized protein LOC107020340 [Solanum pennellii]